MRVLVRQWLLAAFAWGGVLIASGGAQIFDENPAFSTGVIPLPAVSDSSVVSTPRNFLNFDWQRSSDRDNVVSLATPHGAATPAKFREVQDGYYFNGRGGLLAGVEATYLRATTTNTNSQLIPNSQFQYEGAPRVWLEYVGASGWGIRSAYWSYDASAQQSDIDILTANSANVRAATDNLEMYAIDLELTRRIYFERSDLWISVGVRNGKLQRGSVITNTRYYEENHIVIATVDDNTYNFNGTGITSGLGWVRPIGDTNFSFVTNFRNSVLWGGNAFSSEGTLIMDNIFQSELYVSQTQNAYRNGNAMWIGELQVGGEWGRDLSSYFAGTRAFTRIMFEGQWWGAPSLGGAGLNSEFYNLVGVTGAIGFMR